FYYDYTFVWEYNPPSQAIMSRFFLVFCLLSFVGSSASAQTDPLIEYAYEVTDEMFPNPERGFFTYSEAMPGNPMLSASSLRPMRDLNMTLVWRLYTLSSYRNADFPQSFLDQITGDFQ